MRMLMSGVLVVGLLLVFGSSRSSGQGEDKALVGEWIIISQVFDGEKIDVENNAKLVLTKDMANTPGTDGGFKYTVDTSKSPKTIDLVSGELKFLAIYELKKDEQTKTDILTMCWGVVNSGKRATKFESKNGTENQMLVIYRRAK